MNNQLTAQEAALYLGQVATFKSKSFNNETTEAVIAWHIGLLARNAFEYFRLHLRPLSDITEEESIEGGFVKGKDTDQFFHEWVQCWVQVKRKFKPVEVLYLLSQGFDLFGFIEQGKAIDKTKAQS